MDEVGCDANYDDHGEGLQDADEQEHLAQGHGAVAGDRHFEEVEGGLVGKVDEEVIVVVKSRRRDWICPAERRIADAEELE